MYIKQKKIGKLSVIYRSKTVPLFCVFVCVFKRCLRYQGCRKNLEWNSWRKVLVTFMKVKTSFLWVCCSQVIKCMFLLNDSHQINQAFMKSKVTVYIVVQHLQYLKPTQQQRWDLWERTLFQCYRQMTSRWSSEAFLMGGKLVHFGWESNGHKLLNQSQIKSKRIKHSLLSEHCCGRWTCSKTWQWLVRLHKELFIFIVCLPRFHLSLLKPFGFVCSDQSDCTEHGYRLRLVNSLTNTVENVYGSIRSFAVVESNWVHLFKLEHFHFTQLILLFYHIFRGKSIKLIPAHPYSEHLKYNALA